MPVTRKVPLRRPATSNGATTKPQLAPKATPSNYDLRIPDFNVPSDNFEDYTVCLYGAKGIGKSSLAAQNKGFLTFMTEPRRFNLPIRQVPQKDEPSLTWERIKGYLELTAEEPSITGYCIDSIDRAYDLCFETVCEERGCKHPNEKNDYGATWRAIQQEFETVMGIPAQLGKRIWFLSHAKHRDIDELVKSEKFDIVQPTLAPAPYKFIKAVADFLLYYGYVNGRRAITVRGGGEIETGCALDKHFLDPDGNPLRSFYVGDSPEEAYEDLLRAFNNELPDTSWTPPPPPPETIARRKPKKR